MLRRVELLMKLHLTEL